MLFDCIWNPKSKPFYFRVLIYGGLFQILLICFLYTYPKVYRPQQRIFQEDKHNATNDYMTGCTLPVYDFWHPDVMKFIKNDHMPKVTCQTDFRPFTKLVNGSWSIEGQRDCKARCIGRGHNYHDTNLSDWMPPGPVNCEFLEAVCWENGTEIYGYIHTQIIHKKPRTAALKFENAPNVFVFLIDSMSTGRAKRSIPNTVSYLSKTFGAVEFPFVSKVGRNSRPNGIALWTGKLIEPIRIEEFGGVNTPVDWNDTQSCYAPIDNFTIFKDFANHGYMTLNIDDWHDETVLYPNCRGYLDAPIHHHMHQFYETYERRGTNATMHHLKGQLCRLPHNPALEYFEQFVETYKDRQMFTWMWLSTPGHDYLSGLERVDSQLLEFFTKNREMLDNSFVFFMGDHGFQVGYDEFQQSEIGDFERSNPYLSISVPRNLRENNSSIVEALRENSKKLQTHFDTRATLLDILKFQPSASFTNRSVLSIPNERGNSLLREQPAFLRTCGRLPIRSEYCICRQKKISIEDENLRQRYSQKLLDHIHTTLGKSHISEECEQFQLSHVISLHHTHNYEMVVQMKAPSNAVFSAKFFISFSFNAERVEFGAIERLDRYGSSGYCANDKKMEKFCYCRQQLTTPSQRLFTPMFWERKEGSWEQI